jgi:hypothetical protein
MASAQEKQEHMGNENHRKIWLKEINYAIMHEQMYIRAKIEDKQYD